MALTNSQYDEIMRSYENRRLRAEHTFRQRLSDAYRRFPRIEEIESEMAALSLKKARIALELSSDKDFDLNQAIEELSQEKRVLLEAAGFKGGEATAEYECPLCNDTGFIEARRCACLRQAEIRLLYERSGLVNVLREENFDTFDLSVYSDEPTSSGISAKKAARLARDYAVSFVGNFEAEHGNICLFGKTGVGKTFLTHCIAKALMDKGVSVLYLTAFDFFRIFEENTFRRTEESSENSQLIFDCELLIIDDLGTGMNNGFMASQLFNCINERMLTKKSTVISTNLSSSELRDIYSDRVTSRIYSGYQRLNLLGDDIRKTSRIMKKGVKNV